MKQSVSTVETDIEIRNSSFKSVQKETKKIVNSPIYTAERLASLKKINKNLVISLEKAVFMWYYKTVIKAEFVLFVFIK